MVKKILKNEINMVIYGEILNFNILFQFLNCKMVKKILKKMKLIGYLWLKY